MDQAVHIDIEVINVRVAAVKGLGLGLGCIEQDLRISHAHPLEKDRNSHTTTIMNYYQDLIRVIP